jgi:hypothetical protein
MSATGATTGASGAVAVSTLPATGASDADTVSTIPAAGSSGATTGSRGAVTVSTIGAIGASVATGSLGAVTALPLSVGAGPVPVGSEAMPVVLSIAPEVVPRPTSAWPDGVRVLSIGAVASEVPVVPPEPAPVLVVSIGLEAVARSVGLELLVPLDPVSAMPVVLSIAPEVVPRPTSPDGVGVVSSGAVAFEVPVVLPEPAPALALSIALEPVALLVGLELVVPPDPVATVLSTVSEVVVVVLATLELAAVESPAYAFGMRVSEVPSAATMMAIRRPEKRGFTV